MDHSEGGSSRAARAVHIKRLIDDIYAKRGRVRIIDLGGCVEYWRMFPEGYLSARNATVTLVNLYPQHVNSGPFIALAGNACKVDAADQSFDLVHSNSVIEHVGSNAKVSMFAAEVRRLAPAYYVQTPNHWFPYEPHMRLPLVHWLPREVQAWAVRWLQLDAEKRTTTLGAARRYLAHNRLLRHDQLAVLFPDAKIHRERFFGFTKSMMAVRSSH